MKKVMLSLLIIGSLLLICTVILLFNQLAFINNSYHASGNVINFRINYKMNSKGEKIRFYHPIVKYTDKNGHAAYFLSTEGSINPQYELGQEVDVLYTSNHAEIKTFHAIWLVIVFMAMLGIVPIIIALIYFGCIYIKNKRINRLIHKGRCLETIIQSIEVKMFFRFRWLCSYVIYSENADSNYPDIKQVFKSGSFWFNPKPYIKNETISVYIDESNPRRYYMDTRFISAVK